MTEEEKEAIKYLKQIQQDFLNSAKRRRENGEDTGYGTLEDVDKLSAFEIGIILNLIQNQQTEKEQLKAELEKKDKMIDEMAKTILEDTEKLGTFWCNGCYEKCRYSSVKDCIKQYFEKQVGKE